MIEFRSAAKSIQRLASDLSHMHNNTTEDKLSELNWKDCANLMQKEQR